MKPPVKLLERDVTRQHKDYLEYRGWRMIRFQRTVVATSGGAFSTGEPGMPDYAAVRYLPATADPAVGARPARAIVPAPGQPPGSCLMFWLELKRPSGGRLGELQRAWRRREEFRGAIVSCSSNIQEFDRWYMSKFGWLHGRSGVGQQNFLTDPAMSSE